MEHGAQNTNRGRMPTPQAPCNVHHSPPHELPSRARVRSPPLLVPDLSDLPRPAINEFLTWGRSDADCDAGVAIREAGSVVREAGSVVREAGSVDLAVESEWSCFP